MNFTILITAPVFGSQGAYSAYQFCKAALTKNQTITQIFFYGAGVYNANQLVSPPTDETNLVKLWQDLAKQYSIKLYVCVAAAQRRGVLDEQEANQLQMHANLAERFVIAGLGQLIEAISTCDRFITFN